MMMWIGRYYEVNKYVLRFPFTHDCACSSWMETYAQREEPDESVCTVSCYNAAALMTCNDVTHC